jgi:hypothetical protein
LADYYLIIKITTVVINFHSLLKSKEYSRGREKYSTPRGQDGWGKQVQAVTWSRTWHHLCYRHSKLNKGLKLFCQVCFPSAISAIVHSKLKKVMSVFRVFNHAWWEVFAACFQSPLCCGITKHVVFTVQAENFVWSTHAYAGSVMHSLAIYLDFGIVSAKFVCFFGLVVDYWSKVFQ